MIDRLRDGFSSHLKNRLEIMKKVEDFLKKNQGGKRFYVEENENSCTVFVKDEESTKTEPAQDHDVENIKTEPAQDHSSYSQSFAVETSEADLFQVEVDENKYFYEDRLGATEEILLPESINERKRLKGCKCPDCGIIFKRYFSLRQHIKQVHMTKIEELCKQEGAADKTAGSDATLSRVAKRLKSTEQENRTITFSETK